MIALIQRVTRAEVRVGERLLGSIELGIAALVGVRRTDTTSDADRLIERVLGYRIFPDGAGRMNLDLGSVGGGPGSARRRPRSRRALYSTTSCNARVSATIVSPAAISGHTCNCR
jgi:hypothetical protein